MKTGGSGGNGSAGGGSGNPGGSGTGGLLIISTSSLINTGIIQSNGTATYDSNETGGSSGAGSINIFYNDNYENSGTILTQKGITPNGYLVTGGSGGDGSISIGQLLNGTYTSTYTNY